MCSTGIGLVDSAWQGVSASANNQMTTLMLPDVLSLTSCHARCCFYRACCCVFWSCSNPASALRALTSTASTDLNSSSSSQCAGLSPRASGASGLTPRSSLDVLRQASTGSSSSAQQQQAQLQTEASWDVEQFQVPEDLLMVAASKATGSGVYIPLPRAHSASLECQQQQQAAQQQRQLSRRASDAAATAGSDARDVLLSACIVQQRLNSTSAWLDRGQAAAAPAAAARPAAPAEAEAAVVSSRVRSLQSKAAAPELQRHNSNSDSSSSSSSNGASNGSGKACSSRVAMAAAALTAGAAEAAPAGQQTCRVRVSAKLRAPDAWLSTAGGQTGTDAAVAAKQQHDQVQCPNSKRAASAGEQAELLQEQQQLQQRGDDGKEGTLQPNSTAAKAAPAAADSTAEVAVSAAEAPAVAGPDCVRGLQQSAADAASPAEQQLPQPDCSATEATAAPSPAHLQLPLQQQKQQQQVQLSRHRQQQQRKRQEVAAWAQAHLQQQEQAQHSQDQSQQQQLDPSLATAASTGTACEAAAASASAATHSRFGLSPAGCVWEPVSPFVSHRPAAATAGGASPAATAAAAAGGLPGDEASVTVGGLGNIHRCDSVSFSVADSFECQSWAAWSTTSSVNRCPKLQWWGDEAGQARFSQRKQRRQRVTAQDQGQIGAAPAAGGAGGVTSTGPRGVGGPWWQRLLRARQQSDPNNSSAQSAALL